MKIRYGFISNSSSSSYVAVVYRKPYLGYKQKKNKAFKKKEATFQALIKALKLDQLEDSDDWYYDICDLGFKENGHGMFFTHKETGLDVCFYGEGEVRWVGHEIEADLNADKTVTECKQEVISMASKINVDLTLDDLQLEVDESSSE